jgi:acetylornithine deacetylase/succinyl-diaminopimelate desuccinylase-like protein
MRADFNRHYARRRHCARILPTDGGPPVVYGELMTGSDAPTLLFYDHYDVQPPEPVEAGTVSSRALNIAMNASEDIVNPRAARIWAKAAV